jgi:hypothetical protein
MKSLGLRAVHVYVLEARNGATFVRTEESCDGLAAPLLRGRLQKTLDGTLESGLRHLKAEAERRASGTREANSLAYAMPAVSRCWVRRRSSRSPWT